MLKAIFRCTFTYWTMLMWVFFWETHILFSRLYVVYTTSLTWAHSLHYYCMFSYFFKKRAIHMQLTINQHETMHVYYILLQYWISFYRYYKTILNLRIIQLRTHKREHILWWIINNMSTRQYRTGGAHWFVPCVRKVNMKKWRCFYRSFVI